MMPAGHIIACPYLDLDYVSLMLEFRPEHKHEQVLQRQCLHRFWPQFASYAGNRDIPEDLPPGDPTTNVELRSHVSGSIFRKLRTPET